MHLLHTRHGRLAAALAAAVVLAASLVAASRLGSVDETPAQPTTGSPAEASLFRGVEQQGYALGSPSAPVTLVEYADLQCPYCAQWARDALPALVDDYVKTGKLRIVFRGLAFLGPDSDEALRTAIAASRENRLWEIVHGLYAAQGAENSGWVTDELVTEIGGGIPGLDVEKLLDERWKDSVDPEIARAADAAKAAGVTGTPAFELGRTGGPLELVQLDSLDAGGIVPALEAILAA